jgi:protoheme IX farnesyltransferase
MKQYISLMKLRVVELLLVTTVPALFLATNGIPDLSLTFWSLLGGTLAAGGANAFNMVIESNTDKLMKRTANRPISTGQISKRNALLFSSIISLLSLVIFYIFTTELATALTALAIIFYVFGYTIALKRHTSQNIVWGGIAGCMPVLIGQAAVTNSLYHNVLTPRQRTKTHRQRLPRLTSHNHRLFSCKSFEMLHILRDSPWNGSFFPNDPVGGLRPYQIYVHENSLF